MRRLTTRIVPLLAAIRRGACRRPPFAQAPVRRRRGARPAPPSPFAALRRRQRAARQEGPLPRRRRVEARRPPGRRPVPRPDDPGVDEAGDARRSRPTARSSPAGSRASIGQFRTRAIVARRGASAASASPELPLTVFRPRGRHLVRPRLLRQHDRLRDRADASRLVGVAHRSLPCGTNVAVRYGSTDDRRPGRRPRPVRRRGEVGPHRGAPPQHARLHADRPHRRDPPRPPPAQPASR